MLETEKVILIYFAKTSIDPLHFLPFLLAIFAVHVGQYHFPFGGASIPTHG